MAYFWLPAAPLPGEARLSAGLALPFASCKDPGWDRGTCCQGHNKRLID